MIYRDFEIAGLIARFLTGEATREEVGALEEWKEESAGNRALYERLTSAENIDELEAMSQKYDKNEGWSKVRARIDAPAAKTRPRRMWAVAAVAAAVVIGILAMPLFMNGDKEQAELAGDIAPGGFKAKLVLPDGSEVLLDGDNSGEIIGHSGIVLADATINYEQSTLAEADPGYSHLLDVPRGGECRVRLSDGTVVWLNAMTTLRYPARFTGGERRVELSGEAYFEVAHGEIPFVVHTADMDVRVHGTEFNVSAYGDDRTVEATLISGSVSVSAGGGEVTLTPSQQARLDRNGDALTVNEVDTVLYTSWKDGQLRFKDRSLGEIMQTLGRWYDIEEVYYESEGIRDMRFGLNLDRYDRITPILELLNRTGVVKARADGKRIVFSD